MVVAAAAAAAGPAVGGLEDLEDLAPLGQAAAVDRCQQEAEAEAAEALRGNHQDTPWFVWLVIKTSEKRVESRRRQPAQ